MSGVSIQYDKDKDSYTRVFVNGVEIPRETIVGSITIDCDPRPVVQLQFAVESFNMVIETDKKEADNEPLAK